MTNQDHRSRVAAEKRERMRQHLIESALLVFARKGPDAVIDDVIAAAEVSRGTFYNYFKTNEDLMGALLQVLGNELLALVDTIVEHREDPAERMACAVRMVLHTMQRHPLYARLVSKVGIEMAMGNSLAMQYLPRDIQAGIEVGRFTIASLELGLVLVLGTTHAAICGMALHPNPPASFPEDITLHMLLGLGLSKAQARKLAHAPIEDVAFPADALLTRTQGKHTALAA